MLLSRLEALLLTSPWVRLLSLAACHDKGSRGSQVPCNDNRARLDREIDIFLKFGVSFLTAPEMLGPIEAMLFRLIMELKVEFMGNTCGLS